MTIRKKQARYNKPVVGTEFTASGGADDNCASCVQKFVSYEKSAD